MRQETGSNITIIQSRISVRLTASGDLFVIDDVIASLPTTIEESSTIEILTKRMMLIPSQMVNRCKEESDRRVVVDRELASMGITYYNDEEVVTLSRGDVVALVVVPKRLMTEIERRYDPSLISFDTPMLHEAVVPREHIFVDSHLGITTIKVYGGAEQIEGRAAAELRFADIYETPTDAYSIYWIQRLAKAMELSGEIPLYIYRCSPTMQSLLLQTFKNIMICE